MAYQFHFIMLAAGFSKRYGSNKLLERFEGVPLYQITLNKLIELWKTDPVKSLIVVTQFPEIMSELIARKILFVENEHAEEGIASSLRLGLLGTDAWRASNADFQDETASHAYVFFVADQPYLKTETIQKMLDSYRGGILVCASESRRGNPVIFDERYVLELMELKGDIGGKQLFDKYPEEVRTFPVEEQELFDIDYKEN